jgi:hypothetical protein
MKAYHLWATYGKKTTLRENTYKIIQKTLDMVKLT